MAQQIRLGRVFYEFGANTAKFNTAVSKANSIVKSLGRSIAPVVSAAKRIGFAATGAAAGMTYLGKRTAENIDRQAKLAQSLKTTVASIAALERAAELSGLAVKQLEAGFRVFTVQISRLVDGSAPIELAEAFGKLKLSAEELTNLPLAERVATVQEAIEKFIPEAEQAAARAQLFGARTFLAFDRMDTPTLRRATNDLTRFGGVLSDVQADAVEEMNDSLSSLTTGMRAITEQIVAGAAPAVDILADRMAEALEIGSEFRKTLAGIAGFIAEAIPRMGSYAVAIAGVTAAINLLIIALGVATKGALAFRAALLRTGFLVAVVAVGELVYRFTGAAEAAEKYGEAVDSLKATIEGTNAASRRRTYVLEAEARAALAAARAELALREATFEQSAAMQEALKAQAVARAAVGTRPKSRWTQLAGDSGPEEMAKGRLLDADFAVHRLRSQHAHEVKYLKDTISGLEGQLAGWPAGIDGQAGDGETGFSEFTDTELAAQLKALKRRIADAENFRKTEQEKRLIANRRERDEILEGLAKQEVATDELAERTRAAFAEIERSIRGNVSWMERLSRTADDVGTAFGNFTTEAILDFRKMSDAAKSLGQTIARSLVQRSISDSVASAISNRIAGIGAGGGGPALLPSRASGGPSRGLVRVGEQGPELADFGRGATVFSNARLRQIAAMRGGGHVSVAMDVSVSAGGDWDALNDQITKRMVEAAPAITSQAYAGIALDGGRPSRLRSRLRGD